MMRDLFPGWVPPDENILTRYWDEATFAVDTSVLLDLYRFSEEAREGLLKALRSFGERLWIPHQVGLEFHRNRLGVLLDQREAENNLLRELDQIRENLDDQLSRLLRGAGRRDLAPLRGAIDSGFDSLREKLKEAEKQHTKGLGESVRDDPIYEEVVELCAGRVGPPFDDQRQLAVVEDAEERFRNKTPPGYLDSDKDEKTRYGDVILWHQLCQRASETEKPVVLIADDRKTDWVWEVRGKTIGPRPELVAEMSRQAGVGFHLYTPTRFFEVWEETEEGREVEPEVLAEIEGSSEGSSPPTLAAFVKSIIQAVLQGGEEAKTFHRIEEGKVMLMLSYQPELPYAVPPGARVMVRGPREDEAKTLIHPISANERPMRSYIYSLKYPQQFGEGGLHPGTYVVIWEVMQSVDAMPGPPSEVARDYFTIGESLRISG